MRNSSLVKWLCAENVTGLKSNTEALDIDVILMFLKEPRDVMRSYISPKIDIKKK